MKKYNILLPVAGKAQRFLDQGYKMPKPLIMAKTKQVIDWAMESIDTTDCNLIFAVRFKSQKGRDPGFEPRLTRAHENTPDFLRIAPDSEEVRTRFPVLFA